MFSDFLSKNTLTLKYVSFFAIEMDCFNWNEMFLIGIFFIN